MHDNSLFRITFCKQNIIFDVKLKTFISKYIKFTKLLFLLCKMRLCAFFPRAMAFMIKNNLWRTIFDLKFQYMMKRK